MNILARNIKSSSGGGTGPRPIVAALLLLVFVGCLIAYKTTASLAVLTNVQATGILKPRFDLIQPGSSWQGAVDRTVSYFVVVWPALLFGILISGAVRTFVSPEWLVRVFGKGRMRQQVFAGLAGAPLMLCSCCVAPIFTSVYERSEKLAPSIALMLAAPALNPAALVLTFLLFGGKIGTIRLITSFTAVVVTGLLVERLVPVYAPPCPVEPETLPPGNNASVAANFVHSLLKVAAQTLPLIAIGVGISMLITWWLPESGLGSAISGVTAIVLIALVAVPLAMPTFFELPFALLLVAAGLPVGAAVAMLIAGPATNLPSLLTITRSAGWRSAALVAATIWVLSVTGGLLATFCS